MQFAQALKKYLKGSRFWKKKMKENKKNVWYDDTNQAVTKKSKENNPPSPKIIAETIEK